VRVCWITAVNCDKLWDSKRIKCKMGSPRIAGLVTFGGLAALGIRNDSGLALGKPPVWAVYIFVG
jgi:hypothetical protein